MLELVVERLRLVAVDVINNLAHGIVNSFRSVGDVVVGHVLWFDVGIKRYTTDSQWDSQVSKSHVFLVSVEQVHKHLYLLSLFSNHVTLLGNQLVFFRKQLRQCLYLLL